MPVPDILLARTLTAGVSSGEIADTEELLRAHDLGADAIIIPAVVGGGSAAANASMIEDIMAGAPPQSTVRFRDPGPVAILGGLPVIDKAVRLLGASGRWGTRLVPTVDTSDPILDFDVPLPGDIFDVYGPSVERLSIDLRSTPSATGIRTSATTGWFEGYRITMIGGAVHVDNRGTNNRFERMRLIDAGIFFDVDGETGLELTLKDIDATRASAGTTTAGIRVICTTGTTKGDIRLFNVVVNSAASGGAELLCGLLMQSTALGLSVPAFTDMLVIDNCEGPSIKLVNVRDGHFANGWGNSAAGATAAVEIAGGGNHKFIDNTWFGTVRGTYEFTGSNPCAGFISRSNYCPSAYIYRLTGAPPTDVFLDDHVPGATADAQITNDMPALTAARGRTWGGHRWMNDSNIESEPLKAVGGGGGLPAFANSWANVAGTTLTYWRDALYNVHVSGLVESGAAGDVFTLPTGYRSFQTLHFPAVLDDGTTTVVQVTSDGVVHVFGSYPAGSTSLEFVFRWGGG